MKTKEFKKPKTIFLQPSEEHPEFGGITWCQDRQNDDDVEYILKSEYDEIIKKTQLRYSKKEAQEEFIKISKLFKEPKPTDSQKKLDLKMSEVMDKVLKAKSQGYEVDLICDGQVIGRV